MQSTGRPVGVLFWSFSSLPSHVLLYTPRTLRRLGRFDSWTMPSTSLFRSGLFRGTTTRYRFSASWAPHRLRGDTSTVRCDSTVKVRHPAPASPPWAATIAAELGGLALDHDRSDSRRLPADRGGARARPWRAEASSAVAPIASFSSVWSAIATPCTLARPVAHPPHPRSAARFSRGC